MKSTMMRAKLPLSEDANYQLATQVSPLLIVRPPCPRRREPVERALKDFRCSLGGAVLFCGCLIHVLYTTDIWALADRVRRFPSRRQRSRWWSDAQVAENAFLRFFRLRGPSSSGSARNLLVRDFFSGTESVWALKYLCGDSKTQR